MNTIICLEVNMLKVVDNTVQYHICSKCGSKIQYEDSDLYLNHNTLGFDCPCCDEWAAVKECKQYTFPEAFYKYNTTKYNNISNLDIQEKIDQILEHLKHNPDQDYMYIATGDTIVFGIQGDTDNDIGIYVAKNYWENM